MFFIAFLDVEAKSVTLTSGGSVARVDTIYRGSTAYINFESSITTSSDTTGITVFTDGSTKNYDYLLYLSRDGITKDASLSKI